ncbi:prolyl oligopeptidase family serine peptidase [Flavobacterium sp.]|uniref:S9 family peptidase n=1 Tax=Flavobacterium sp. TaxID=239 RepID=UPI0025C612B6|nr:prolyl oligopeptidase family serine peptidase [Flavobacterium sp.]
MIGSYRREKASFLWLLFWLVSSACPAMGQVNPKKVLTEDDYILWGRLSMGRMNAEGSWMSWRMLYEDGTSMLYVGRTSGKSLPKVFARATRESFVGRKQFAYCDPNNLLRVLDLEKGGEWEKAGIVAYECFDKFGLLLLQKDVQSGLSQLEIVDFKGQRKLEIANVESWTVNPEKNKIALVLKEGGASHCVLLRLEDLVLKKVSAYLNGEVQMPVWDNYGKYLAFANTAPEHQAIYLFDTTSGTLDSMAANGKEIFSDGRTIANSFNLQLRVKDDGSSVFFNTKRDKGRMKKYSDMVEIWNASDKLVYPAQKILDGAPELLMAQWDVRKGSCVLIADTKTPLTALTGNKDFAITWDDDAYEPHFERNGPADYYLTDLKSGIKVKWLTKMPFTSVHPLLKGNQIVYRDNGWRLFDPARKIVTELDIPDFKETPNKAINFQSPASDLNGKYLLTNDGFDIWKLDMNTLRKVRLTHGREKNLTYSLPEKSDKIDNTGGLRALRCFDLSKQLVLHVRNQDGSFTGLAMLHPDGRVTQIAHGREGYPEVIANAEKTHFAFVTESFATSKAIKSFVSGKTTKIFQSNKQQNEYYWGHAELIKYKVGTTELQGILYCPENIEKEKKYPLVTDVYQVQSDKLHTSFAPSLINFTGFNVANLVAKGYYVLLPDLAYGWGNTGMDATICVNAAIDTILEGYPVDTDKLGLIGHSFGGYETAAIVGYTNRFRAAVMGCGVSIASSMYLRVNPNTSKPEYWRLERDQWKIGKSLFENKKAFDDNSPAFNAEKIVTPLLIWTGKEDRQVLADQSYNMHLALRRLGKQSTMLIYPNEGHSIVKPDASKDLTKRIEEWFDHFLKGSESDWIK